MLTLSVLQAGASEQNSVPRIPSDVAVFKAHWMISAFAQQLCSKHFPDLASVMAAGTEKYQRAIRRAEALVRTDAAEQGAMGGQYLADFIAQGQSSVDEVTEASIVDAPQPDRESCQVMAQVVPTEQFFLGEWQEYVRRRRLNQEEAE